MIYLKTFLFRKKSAKKELNVKESMLQVQVTKKSFSVHLNLINKALINCIYR